jgi:murein DD-endopeptidase MepM/ murein hydrolase activator NlpD
MNDLKIYFPFKPYIITQRWGNPTDAYSTQFNDPNFTEHNGVDAFTGGKPPTGWPVYCPVDGFVVESVSYEQNGGGNQISLISKEKLQVFEQLCYVRIWLCHAEKILVPVGYEPALGELLMIADNTGFSTGPHTHLGVYRLNDQKQKIDANKATGSFDPSLFFTNKYAVDVASWGALFKSGLRLAKYYASA